MERIEEESGGIEGDAVVFHDVEYLEEDYDRAAKCYAGLFAVFLASPVGAVLFGIPAIFLWTQGGPAVPTWELLIALANAYLAWRLYVCFQDAMTMVQGRIFLTLSLLVAVLCALTLAYGVFAITVGRDGDTIAEMLGFSASAASVASYLALARLTQRASIIIGGYALVQAARHVAQVTWAILACYALYVTVALIVLATETFDFFILSYPMAFASVVLIAYWILRYLMLLWEAQRLLRGAALRQEQRLSRRALSGAQVSAPAKRGTPTIRPTHRA